MRRSPALLGALLILAAVFVYLAAFHHLQGVRDHPYFDAPGTWVVAHRGGMALAPENTVEAFRRALVLGVDVLEMDLRFTTDGEIVLMHDETVDRTTNGKGRVADMRVAEIRRLDAGYRFVDGEGRFPFRGTGVTVPSLPEVLHRFPHTRLNVEMKEFTPGEARELCAVFRGHEAVDRVLVSAFGHAPMIAFREACPEVPTGATRREALTFYWLNRVRLGSLFRSPATTLQLPLRFRGRAVITPQLLEAARNLNRHVQAWTVNDEVAMRRLLELDVQAILTDRPDRLLALMGRARPPAVSAPRSPGHIPAGSRPFPAVRSRRPQHRSRTRHGGRPCESRVTAGCLPRRGEVFRAVRSRR